jgi:hypothetical protein
MKVYTVWSGWSGTILIGVYDSREKALVAARSEIKHEDDESYIKESEMNSNEPMKTIWDNYCDRKNMNYNKCYAQFWEEGVPCK